MTLFTTTVGFLTGISLQLYSNGVRKLPYLRQPWLFPLFGIAGAWAGSKYPGAVKSLRDDVNAERKLRGLPPLREGESFPDVRDYNIQGVYKGPVPKSD